MHAFTITRGGQEYTARVWTYAIDRRTNTLRIVYEYDSGDMAEDRIGQIDHTFTLDDIVAAGIAPASLNLDAAAEALARLKWEDKA